MRNEIQSGLTQELDPGVLFAAIEEGGAAPMWMADGTDGKADTDGTDSGDGEDDDEAEGDTDGTDDSDTDGTDAADTDGTDSAGDATDGTDTGGTGKA
jgi:hypothetical protein